MTNPLTPIVELFGAEVRHCADPFASQTHDQWMGPDTLPYSDLKGPGFERLCFEILLSQGYEPRFFGRSGQRQPDVDLLTFKDCRYEVFSCKNLAERFTDRLLAQLLEEFETKWVKQLELPKPARFVICWPQPLRDANLEAKWIRRKSEFSKRTGIEADIWHLDLLNGWLKKLPDLVADLFSDRHAEGFCNLDDWKMDLFVPLREGTPRDRRLGRFFESNGSGRLYLDEGYAAKITDALENSPVILVRGLPGTGKTFTSLATARGFRNSRWRTWFLDVSAGTFTPEQMAEGIRRRIRSRPSIFVLENCHARAGAIYQVLGSLKRELDAGHLRVICLARWVNAPGESRSDVSDLFGELEANSAVVDLKNDDELLKRVARFWRPNLDGLSNARLDRLWVLCARDLLLLDLLLDENLHLIDVAEEIDTLAPADLYDRVRTQYFGGKTANSLKATRQLAALAQLEIRPLAKVIPIPAEEFMLINSLCVEAERPPRWHFLHSSAAELVLHALWAGEGVLDPEEVARYAASDIIDYLDAVQAAGVRPPESLDAVEAALLAVVTSRLTLARAAGESVLRAKVLDSDAALNLAPLLVGLTTYAQTMSRVTLVAHRSGAGSTEKWARHLRDIVAGLSLSTAPSVLTRILPVLGMMLRTLKLASPALYDEVNGQFRAKQLLELIEANGTIFDLFKIISNVTPKLANEMVAALDRARAARLIQKTIEERRSIGTLNLALFTLCKNEDTVPIGAKLEELIGAALFLELIEANGTIFELFNIISNVTPKLANEMVAALDRARAARLIQKTINEGRSIGTLNYTLDALNGQSEQAELGPIEWTGKLLNYAAICNSSL